MRRHFFPPFSRSLVDNEKTGREKKTFAHLGGDPGADADR